ncbi:MAG: hypothetical protein AAF734_03920, partial [Bacteroidota bacterium]
MAKHKEIDFYTLEKLSVMGCTTEEIAGVLNVTLPTLRKKVKEKYGKSLKEYCEAHKTHGKVSIRRKLFEEALKGNTRILL